MSDSLDPVKAYKGSFTAFPVNVGLFFISRFLFFVMKCNCNLYILHNLFLFLFSFCCVCFLLLFFNK